MPIEIQEATQDDATVLADVGHQAFLNDLHMTTMINFVGATPEQLDEYRTWRIERGRLRLAKSGSHWIKAVDTETGDVAGFTCIMEPSSDVSSKPTDRPVYPHIVNQAIMEERMAILDKVRAEVLGDRKDFWCRQCGLSWFC